MIVGTELVKYDRPSFDDFYPRHLEELFELCDYLHVRVDNDSIKKVTPFFKPYGDWISWEPQGKTERWEEAEERQALLDWAVESGAEWNVALDADEVLEPGSGRALRSYLRRNTANRRVYRMWLSYCSHHRPGFLLPRKVIAFRFFKLDNYARTFRFEGDQDGMHCGTVPYPHVDCGTIKNVHLLHFHAVNCEEYLAERRFYEGGAEVRRWADENNVTPEEAIDHLYACNRFGDEHLAFPESDLESDREVRYARLSSK